MNSETVEADQGTFAGAWLCAGGCWHSRYPLHNVHPHGGAVIVSDLWADAGERRCLSRLGRLNKNQQGNPCGRIYGRTPATFSNRVQFQLGWAFDRTGSRSKRLMSRLTVNPNFLAASTNGHGTLRAGTYSKCLEKIPLPTTR